MQAVAVIHQLRMRLFTYAVKLFIYHAHVTHEHQGKKDHLSHWHESLIQLFTLSDQLSCAHTWTAGTSQRRFPSHCLLTPLIESSRQKMYMV